MRHYDHYQNNSYYWRDSMCFAMGRWSFQAFPGPYEVVGIYGNGDTVVVKWTGVREFFPLTSLFYYDVDVRQMLQDHANSHFEELSDLTWYESLRHLFQKRGPTCGT